MNHLKLLLLTTAVFAFAASASAQEKKDMPSPPASASEEIGGTSIEINYHSPAVKNRPVYAEGALVPTGEVWRTGANNATTFEVGKDVKVEGETLKAGKYALFTIANEDEWTIIFNKVADQWGAYDYDEKEDALRVKVKPMNDQEMQERFTIDINEEGDKSAEVVLAWEKKKVPFTVEVM